MMAAGEGVLDRDGMRTWYRVAGEPVAGRAPLVVCHGGPGLTHDYLDSLADLAAERQVVFYDQYGSGRSGRRPDAPEGFWTVELYLRELTALLGHLGAADGFHLLGHSWGGMLALELAVAGAPGLRSVVAVSAFARSATYTEQVRGLLAALPDEVREPLVRHEAAGTTGSAEYQDAVRGFYRLHVCRRRPVPEEVLRTLGALVEDATVYRAMAGPNEFSLTGSLRDWDISGRLDAVTAPVLLVSGEHDEVTPAAVAELHAALPGSRWELIEDASHMSHVEQPERFRAAVAGFLGAVDARAATVMR